MRAVEAWLQVADCRFGPVFRAVDRWGGIETRRLHPDAVRRILLRRTAAAGLEGTALEPITAHGLRAGFVTQAYKAGLRDEDIMGHTPAWCTDRAGGRSCPNPAWAHPMRT